MLKSYPSLQIWPCPCQWELEKAETKTPEGGAWDVHHGHSTKTKSCRAPDRPAPVPDLRFPNKPAYIRGTRRWKLSSATARATHAPAQFAPARRTPASTRRTPASARRTPASTRRTPASARRAPCFQVHLSILLYLRCSNSILCRFGGAGRSSKGIPNPRRPRVPGTSTLNFQRPNPAERPEVPGTSIMEFPQKPNTAGPPSAGLNLQPQTTAPFLHQQHRPAALTQPPPAVHPQPLPVAPPQPPPQPKPINLASFQRLQPSSSRPLIQHVNPAWLEKKPPWTRRHSPRPGHPAARAYVRELLTASIDDLD